MLQFQWHCIDYVVRPGPHAAGIAATVLAWATERLEIEAEAWDEPLRFYVGARADDTERIAQVEGVGFAQDEWRYVHLGRDLRDSDLAPSTRPPEGFQIRPLAGDDEVAAYVACHRAAFGSEQMTVAWRSATLRHPHYEPELDLVAVAPDGKLAGFCVGWITPPLPSLAGGRVAQVEPLGVHPSYQRRGLGRALLADAFRRAQRLGAVRIEVDAAGDNDASQGTYAAAGFRPLFEAPFFLRHFGAGRGR